MKLNIISAFFKWYKRKKRERRLIDAFLSDPKSIDETEELCKQITSYLTSEEFCYKQIEVINLTSEELRAIRLPDCCFDGISIEFTSKAGKPYWAHHSITHKKEPYILLSSDGQDYDKADFKRVEKIIVRETRGKPEHDLNYERNSGIKDSINLMKRPTREMLADFVERYTKHFGNIKIIACFRDVPKSFYENLSLPLEKLIVEQYYRRY